MVKIAHKKNSTGSALMMLIVVIGIVAYAAVRLTLVLSHEYSMKKGGVLAQDTLYLIDIWSRAMDYRCVRQDTSAVTVSDLDIPQVIKPKIPNVFALQISAPPSPQVRITVNILNDVARASYVNELKSLAAASQLAPVITFSQVGNQIVVTAVRGNGALSSAAYGNKSNSDAAISSVIMGGAQKYGFSGC